jgi:microcystin-dependent protein
MSTPYIGEIRMVGFNFAPQGWAFCNGQTIPIAENDALFTLIGTTYGGDGQETFALPNLQSRFPIHAGQGPGLTNRTLAEVDGTESVTLTVQQIPTHTHQLFGSGNAATEETPQGNMTGQPVTNIYGNLPAFTEMDQNVVGSAGGSQPHENVHPFQVINFIISLYGIFPTQT